MGSLISFILEYFLLELNDHFICNVVSQLKDSLGCGMKLQS